MPLLDRAADQIAAGGPDAADLTWSAADHLSVTARLLEPDQLDGPLHEAARHAARAGRELHAGVPASRTASVNLLPVKSKASAATGDQGGAARRAPLGRKARSDDSVPQTGSESRRATRGRRQ